MTRLESNAAALDATPLTLSDSAASPAVALDARFPRLPLALAMVMLFISALPDAMVVPLLNELFVERYGVSAAAAHWFMAVNLIGAVAAIPVLAFMRRRLAPATVLLVAAIANTIWLAVMYLPIGFASTVGVRLVEGAADLVVFAVLFDLLAKAGPDRSRGRRLGLAGMVLMFGLFGGAVIGGVAGQLDARSVFLVAASAMLIVAIAAAGAARLFNMLVRSCPVVSDGGEIATKRRPLWPALSMVFSDRAVAGLMTATLPLYFATVAGQSTVSRGWLIGLPLLTMALGAWPMGLLGDRVGHLKLRTAAALVYAGSIAAIPFVAASSMTVALAVMGLVGFAGAALLPTALALTSRAGRGSVAMGGYRAAGDVGYLLGIAGAGALLGIFGSAESAAETYTNIIFLFAAAHLLITAISTVGCLRR